MTEFLNIIAVMLLIVSLPFAFWITSRTAKARWFFITPIAAFIVSGFIFQAAENVDPNWCEKWVSTSPSLYANWDEYERRCLD